MASGEVWTGFHNWEDTLPGYSVMPRACLVASLEVNSVAYHEAKNGPCRETYHEEQEPESCPDVSSAVGSC